MYAIPEKWGEYSCEMWGEFCQQSKPGRRSCREPRWWVVANTVGTSMQPHRLNQHIFFLLTLPENFWFDFRKAQSVQVFPARQLGRNTKNSHDFGLFENQLDVQNFFRKISTESLIQGPQCQILNE
jgi:hypothetical protein